MNLIVDPAPDAALLPDARHWVRRLSRYKTPDSRRAALELGITVVPFVALWAAMAVGMTHGLWPVLLLVVPTAGLLVRLFMIQHDCGHGSFFASRIANDWIGRLIGVLTLTPYAFWKQTHATHHASSGSLEQRGIGDIDTLTVEEYRARSATDRLKYRLYRHPLVMFGLGPAYLFLIQHRLPVGLFRAGWRPWASAMGTNATILVLVLALLQVITLPVFLLVHLPVLLIASTIGVWLFFVQHQFEQTVWESETQWQWHDAALNGSSHYDLPWILRWFTANIGVHHVHHLCSRIPFYRLPEVLRDHPELRDVNRLTLSDSLGCVRLALWDEDRRRLVGFRDVEPAMSMN